MTDRIETITTPAAMAARAAEFARRGVRVGFVPTMGALHDGHLKLVRTARAENDVALVSIFVNPLQFGPNEDFTRYPRDLDGDLAKLATVGCDAVFTTDAASMYPRGFATYVVNDALTDRFEGSVRPGHFRGVLTVVAKLFHLVRPAVAYFGQKDAQQALLIRRMVADLDFPLQVSVQPTVREPDGLARSSRNVFLSQEGRTRGLALSRGLKAAAARFAAGERSAAALIATARGELEATAGVGVDYVALVHADTLEDVRQADARALMLVAARVDGVRLLDNALLSAPTEAAW